MFFGMYVIQSKQAMTRRAGRINLSLEMTPDWDCIHTCMEGVILLAANAPSRTQWHFCPAREWHSQWPSQFHWNQGELGSPLDHQSSIMGFCPRPELHFQLLCVSPLWKFVALFKWVNFFGLLLLPLLLPSLSPFKSSTHLDNMRVVILSLFSIFLLLLHFVEETHSKITTHETPLCACILAFIWNIGAESEATWNHWERNATQPLFIGVWSGLENEIAF